MKVIVTDRQPKKTMPPSGQYKFVYIHELIDKARYQILDF